MKIGILEGLLFVTGEDGLSLEDIKSLLDISEEEALKLIDEYKESLLSENRGLKLVFDIPKEQKNDGTASFTLGILSTDKIRKELGWAPKYSIHDGFKRTIEYLESELKKDKPKTLERKVQ